MTPVVPFGPGVTVTLSEKEFVIVWASFALFSDVDDAL
jgi:hypothetical protein